jgi:hypothetical protein
MSAMPYITTADLKYTSPSPDGTAEDGLRVHPLVEHCLQFSERR